MLNFMPKLMEVISDVQASGGIQSQPSRFGPDQISAAAAAARFTCQYGSRNGSRPLNKFHFYFASFAVISSLFRRSWYCLMRPACNAGKF
jgi:hypothetical protein